MCTGFSQTRPKGSIPADRVFLTDLPVLLICFWPRLDEEKNLQLETFMAKTGGKKEQIQIHLYTYMNSIKEYPQFK